MKNFALKNIQEMSTYIPPLAGRRQYAGVLLDFNERTRPVSKQVRRVLMNFAKNGKMNLYPEYGNLEAKIAEYAGVEAEEILVTNGSDQGIELIFRIFTRVGDKVIIPGPSFVMFERFAEIIGCRTIRPTYKKSDFAFPIEEILELIDNGVRLIVICNPNNPSGTPIKISDIEKICKSLKNGHAYGGQSPSLRRRACRQAGAGLVLVDEAYFEFSRLTVVSLLKKYPNLIISRTFSKAFGLASLRIGYLMASKPIVQELLKVRGPYDVNMPAYLAAISALENRSEMEKYVAEVMTRAKPMVEEFFRKNGIKFYKSAANFVLFRVENPLELTQSLASNGFLVRPQKNVGGCLRVSIGTVKEMRAFIKIFKKII